MITAVLVDSREPNWVKNLKFEGVPVMTQMLDVGDVHAVTNDGKILVIERKTPNDFLGSLRDDRVLMQVGKMADLRLREQLGGTRLHWPYLVITGWFMANREGQVITDRETGWNFAAVQGALLSIQEMGVPVVHCAGDSDFEACVVRLGQRNRESVKLLPLRPPELLGPQMAVLTAFPGIGIDKAESLLKAAGSLDYALEWLSGDNGYVVPGVADGLRKRAQTVLTQGGSNENRLAVVGK